MEELSKGKKSGENSKGSKGEDGEEKEWKFINTLKQHALIN